VANGPRFQVQCLMTVAEQPRITTCTWGLASSMTLNDKPKCVARPPRNEMKEGAYGKTD